MADRGITFSAPMVRALLEGRKTQTRRLLPNREYYGCPTGDCPHNRQADCDAAMQENALPEVRHQPGDRLYVREHWKTTPAYDDLAPSDMGGDEPLLYLADGATFNWAEADGVMAGRHRQGMHMPRWASRIWLPVTDVRVQRVQDISEADAIAEGIINEWVIVGVNCNGGRHGEDCDWRYWHGAGDEPDEGFESAVDAYAALWNSLHTEPGTRWEDNPWIYAVTFEVKLGNIDQIGAA